MATNNPYQAFVDGFARYPVRQESWHHAATPQAAGRLARAPRSGDCTNEDGVHALVADVLQRGQVFHARHVREGLGVLRSFSCRAASSARNSWQRAGSSKAPARESLCHFAAKAKSNFARKPVPEGDESSESNDANDNPSQGTEVPPRPQWLGGRGGLDVFDAL